MHAKVSSEMTVNDLSLALALEIILQSEHSL